MASSGYTTDTGAQLVVACAADGDPRFAERLAAHLGTHPVDAGEVDSGTLALRVDGHGLALVGDGMELRADLAQMVPRLKPANLHRELLVRAAKIKGADGARTAVDATAGLGDDSLLLAAAGFSVTLVERDPVIAALLADALRRAKDDERLVPLVARMRLIEGESSTVLRGLPEPPDVVYLDPMFPGRQKSAAVKKKFQLLHHLERPCEDQDELMRAALDARPRKVVVKRPVKGPWLADVKPSYSLVGKAVRYDCIVPPRP